MGKAQSAGHGQALSKDGNTAHGACALALWERDSVLRFLPRTQPLPAKRALIGARTGALSVTALFAWPTNTGLQFQRRAPANPS